MAKDTFEAALEACLAEGDVVTNRELTARTGLSRQAVHARLQALVDAGELAVEGKARATHYRRTHKAGRPLTYPREGLEEDRVWNDVIARVPAVRELPAQTEEIIHYAFTEMVNNAIDHSDSRRVDVSLKVEASVISFMVEDDGVGVFPRLRTAYKLASDLEALQELMKGKVTTQPERHSGEGIFFSSKIADTFEIESDGLAWLVDNLREDMAAQEVPRQPGTRVRFIISRQPRKSLAELFAEYTDEFEFSRTRIHIHLFEKGVRFVSRSEAKRLLNGLERFREVVLDFKGVQSVGQGFADEVFRVWALEHPKIRLVPVQMAPAVEFMVQRAIHAARSRGE